MSSINIATQRLAALLAGQPLGTAPAPAGLSYPGAAPPAGGMYASVPSVVPRKLSPQEEVTYFLLPVHSSWTPSKIAWTPLIQQDSRRISVIWTTTGQCFLTTDPSQTINQSGIFVTSAQPLVITEKEFGPLASLPWFGSTSASAVLPILFSTEILLREWPEGGL